MTLALASEYAPNWPLLGVIFLICFFGPIVLLVRAGQRTQRGTKANLQQRMTAAHHDAMVEAERRRARAIYADDPKA